MLSTLSSKTWLFALNLLAVSIAHAQQAGIQDSVELSETRVSGKRESLDEAPAAIAGDQVAGASRMGLLGRVGVMETPFSVTSYTAETVENMQAQSVADVLQADPSVRMTSSRSHLAEGISIRGLVVTGADYAQNGMFGLTPFGRTNLEAMERIEIIKGPSAALFGMSPGGSVGGVINLVPKRAGDKPITRLTLSAAQDSVLGAHLDVGRRFGEADRFGLRVNLVQREGNTAMDDQSMRRKLAALGADFRGDKLRVSLDVQYSLEDVNNTARPFNIDGALDKIPKAPDGKHTYAGAGDYVSDDLSGVIRLDYALSEVLNLYAGYGQHRYKADNMLLYPRLLNSNGNYQYQPNQWSEQTDRNSAEFGLRGYFNTGAVSHRFALGFSRVEQDRDTFTAVYPLGTANLYQRSKIKRPAHINGKLTPQTSVTLTSVALADTLGFMDERLLLTFGLRNQRVQSKNHRTTVISARKYDEKENSPFVGILYKASDVLSFYANYVEGLSQGPIAPNNNSYSNANEQFAPYVTEQYEIGAKFDWGNWTSALAVYSLTRPVAGDLPDGSSPPAWRKFGVFGKQRNRGVEATAAGEVLTGVRVLGGVALMESEIYKSPDPNLKGNEVIGTGKVQANLGGEWDMPFLPGATVHARAIHTSRRAANASNSLHTPSWQRIDAGLRYQTKDAGGRSYTARLNVENLTNTRYWGVGTLLYLGAPRTWTLSLSTDI